MYSSPSTGGLIHCSLNCQFHFVSGAFGQKRSNNKHTKQWTFSYFAFEEQCMQKNKYVAPRKLVLFCKHCSWAKTQVTSFMFICVCCLIVFDKQVHTTWNKTELVINFVVKSGQTTTTNNNETVHFVFCSGATFANKKNNELSGSNVFGTQYINPI